MMIKSSSLALRFYASDGWTQELLDSLTLSGKIVKHPHFEQDEKTGWGGYFVSERGTKLDILELMKIVTKVVRRFDDYPEESDESFLLRMLV